ncbi:SDR family oxidoreductase [uncultured Selenomonas sp.]|uniref:SDR family oxidoreductase n=1 Tax=uncultured Selenomonas sp. TaxID=159275 RepID=UPI0025858A11|nr:SDR family oxidoreductase [uncultured Selenomonas sp.]
MTQDSEDTTDVQSIVNQELLGIGKPADVTGMILFLLSDRAAWITGAHIPVDGGYLA